MIYRVLVVILTFFLTNCQDSQKGEKEEYCNYLKNLAHKEIEKGNISPVLKGKYIYSEIERYYIWKKYRINIVYPIEVNQFYQIELDSCYNSVMIENSPVNEIIEDLDSLTQLKAQSKFEYPKTKFIRQYYDGVYFVGLDANNKKFAPKRLDTNYNSQLEAFTTQFEASMPDTLKCEFWYRIDTLGNVVDLEIYHHATPKIDKAVKEFYTSFKYAPANDGNIKLNYRGYDYIYFRGNEK